MKRLLAIVSLSAAVASSGCAHNKPLTNQEVIRGAVYSTAFLVVIGVAVYRAASGPDAPNPNGPTYQPQ